MSDHAHFRCHVAYSAASSRSRVVGKDKIGRDSEEGAHSPLEDEKPLPAGETPRAVKAGEDSGGDEARECLGEDKTGVEQGYT